MSLHWCKNARDAVSAVNRTRNRMLPEAIRALRETRARAADQPPHDSQLKPFFNWPGCVRVESQKTKVPYGEERGHDHPNVGARVTYQPEREDKSDGGNRSGPTR